MVKRAYPDFHKALMDQSIYPSAKRRIKFEETHQSYLYRTGDFFYKIPKIKTGTVGEALKELYANEALEFGQRWAPDVVKEIFPLYQRDSGEFSFQPPGKIREFALQSVQVSDNFWLNKQIEKGHFTPTAVGRLARFLAERHLAYPAQESAADAGRPEHLRELAEEIFYQTKKYTGLALPNPLLDVVSLPFYRFIDDNRRLFTRRLKKGRVVECHGALFPEHIFLRSRQIFAISPIAGSQKYRILDATNDLAIITNSLYLAGDKESPALLAKRYGTAAKDRDVNTLLPVFETFQAMRIGLMLCEWQAEEGPSEEQKTSWVESARRYFNLAAERSRNIPRG